MQASEYQRLYPDSLAYRDSFKCRFQFTLFLKSEFHEKKAPLNQTGVLCLTRTIIAGKGSKRGLGKIKHLS